MPRTCGGSATRTASGRSACTARSTAGSGRCTAPSGTPARCCAEATCSTPSVARSSSGRPRSALERTAVVEDGLANWPGAEGGPLEIDGEIRLQWCQGAPGIVACASDYLGEELLLAGAELVWRAGPPGPEKGAGICHGTAGNGYALLKAFEWTGDEVWLERARRFAVHALAQIERGPGRYSLWTGGVGVALFAADCLDGRAGYPIMDAC